MGPRDWTPPDRDPWEIEADKRSWERAEARFDHHWYRWAPIAFLAVLVVIALLR
jgi:hypothetical protein